jgi:hypothetical protein
MATDALAGLPVQRPHYVLLLSTLASESGHPDHPMPTGNHLWETLRRADARLSKQIGAMEAATDRGHVLAWVDGAGTPRYGLSADIVESIPEIDAPIYGPADTDALRAIAATEAASDDPDGDVIAFVNQHMEAIDG